MTIKDILHKKVITTTKDEPLTRAMKTLIENKISCLPVVEADGKLVGIISDKDIFRKVHETSGKYHEVTVGECMTTELLVGLPTDEVAYIAGVMTENRIRHVPIVDGGQMIGLISIGDIVKTQMENIKVENRYLKEYITGKYPA
jgi:CBS domain-containing protein